MSSDHKNKVDIINNISRLKKYLYENKIEKIKNMNRRTTPRSQRKYRTLNNSNIYKTFSIKTDNDLYIIKEKENENNKLRNRISELEKEIKRQKEDFKNQILILNENNENSKNETNEKIIISKLKRKINILSDENISLLIEIKKLKNKIMNLKKDKQYLIEQITDLNKSLNNKIKQKLNENEDDLMSLKSQIIELKNKNNRLLKKNYLQKEIIKDLKGEIFDIHQKTSLLCKDSSIIENNEYQNDIEDAHKKNYLSMKNLNDYKNKYYIGKINNRINTENSKYNNPFYKTKNGMYINNSKKENMTNRVKLNLNNDISYVIDGLVNSYNKRKNKTPKYNNKSFNEKNKFNKLLLMKKSKEKIVKDNNEYILNFKMNSNKNNLYKNNNQKNNYNYHYYRTNEKFNNINSYDNGNEEDIKTRNAKLNNNVSNNKSMLSSYIDEDNYNFI